jgi:hypothetical protein
MYIKSIFSKQEDFRSAKDYRKILKPLTSINLRRASKINLMGVFGAIKVLEEQEFDKKLTIYIASENGCMTDMIKVIKETKNSEFLMPFDFLNINGNNTGFLISQALKTHGNNLNISSGSLCFEKALQMAIYDNNIEHRDFLVALIDESLTSLEGYEHKKYKKDTYTTFDNNHWIYLSPNKKDSFAKIETAVFLSSIKELNNYLHKLTYKNFGLNSLAKKYIDEINLNADLVFKDKKDCSFNLLNFISTINEDSIYISLDSKKRAYLFIIKKY